MRAGSEPLRLRPGDFVLIRTCSPFRLSSDVWVEAEDSEALVAASGDPVLRLGAGKQRKAMLRGGRFAFDATNEQLLTGLLPPLIHVRGDDTASWRLQGLLKLNESESARPGVGSEFIVTRLVEIVLVEVLRREALRVGMKEVDEIGKGLLAGLSDAVTSRALEAMHAQVARTWTVGSLARLCGVSRSGFAARFRTIMGVGPIEYLLRWRMSLAKDKLRAGGRSVGEIALAVGFQSSSAFSRAFSKAVGCSPREFVRRGDG